jgi:hypothetical protein
MRALRERGDVCAVVEKWNAYGGPHGIRQDLFGIIDILVLDPEKGVIGIQACAGSGFRAHIRKLTEERAENTEQWLRTPGTSLWIWAWRKVKKVKGGKAMIWQPRVQEITLDDLEG